MKKILTAIDVYLTAIIPYVLITTLTLICTKALGYVGYSWLVAISPILLTAAFIGVTNFLIFILDKLDKEGEDDKTY